MAKEIFKAEYRNGHIKTTHTMSYKHLRDLHKDLTKMLAEMEAVREPVMTKPRIVKKPIAEEQPVVISVHKATSVAVRERIVFCMVGSEEAADGLPW